MKIGEGTEFKIDIKTVVSIIVVTSMFVGMYYSLASDIEEAKKLPPSEIKRLEYDLKRQWTESHILELESKVKEIEEELKNANKFIHYKETEKRR